MPDLEVIHRYLETQANPCFNLLYKRYASKVYSKCLSLLKEEAMAQDATQEIFMKIFTNLSRFREQAKFSTWVYSITYNYCIDFLRRDKKSRDLFAEDIEKLPDTAEEDIPDEAILGMEVKVLKEVLDLIPPGDKTVLLMKYQDDMSIRDIAAILNKTESAVKMKLKRAKEKALQIRATIVTEN